MKTKRMTGIAWIVPMVLGIGLIAQPAVGELAIQWWTVDGGGHSFTTSGSLRLGGTCGQPDPGALRIGDLNLSSGFWRGGEMIVMAIEEPPVAPPESAPFRLVAGAPNPFQKKTAVLLDLPESRKVHVRIHDHTGRLIRNLCNQTLPAGHHQLDWDGCSDGGQRAASGVYLLRISAGDYETSRRLILLR